MVGITQNWFHVEETGKSSIGMYQLAELLGNSEDMIARFPL